MSNNYGLLNLGYNQSTQQPIHQSHQFYGDYGQPHHYGSHQGYYPQFEQHPQANLHYNNYNQPSFIV